MNYKLKSILLVVTLLVASVSFGQTDTLIFVAPQVMPSFPGGDEEMANFINANLIYPEAERKAKISGTCFLSFVVEKDGAVTNPKLLRGVKNCPACDIEAFRIVGVMPKWNPGKQNGMNVRTKLNVPIKFMIPEFNQLSVNDTAFYFNTELCAREDASYYRTAVKLEQGYLVKENSVKDNHVVMEAMCKSLNPFVKNGNCITYSDSEKHGKLTEGIYEEDKRVGIWTIWEKDNQDSLVVECFTDGTYKNKFVPANRKNNVEMNVAYKVEVMPQFPGGEAMMMSFIQKTMKYPTEEKERGIQGKVYITFTVEKDGKITDARVLKGVVGGKGLEEEGLRVIRSMPTWTPGTQWGTPVRVQFNMPFLFKMK